MQDARYLRAQARLCLEIASQLSDPKAAERLRAEAADYHARAAELEEGPQPARLEAFKKPVKIL